MQQKRLRNFTASMSKVVRSKSTKRESRSHAAVAIALVVDEDFLAVDREGAVDVEVISCVSSRPESRRSET